LKPIEIARSHDGSLLLEDDSPRSIQVGDHPAIFLPHSLENLLQELDNGSLASKDMDGGGDLSAAVVADLDIIGQQFGELRSIARGDCVLERREQLLLTGNGRPALLVRAAARRWPRERSLRRGDGDGAPAARLQRGSAM
jgi:hypothetical protein